MSTPVTRIAYVAEADNALARRFASGVCQFATPERGYITREFFVGENSTELPEACSSWEPAAFVLFVSGEHEAFLQAVAAGGRPFVNMSRCEPAPGRGVVLGDAEEAYNLIHGCFRRLGRTHVEQFIICDGAIQSSLRERYRQYTQSHQVPFHSFAVEDSGDTAMQNIEAMTTVDPRIASWLLRIPKPAGIFSQNSLAGALLCRCCGLLGIRVPEEIAIIGTDGFDIAIVSKPSLTTFRIPAEKIGFEAAQLATQMLAGGPAPREIVRISGIRLIERESTGRNIGKGVDIDAAQEFIRAHACEGIRVNDVVSHTQSVSRMTFHKRFTEMTGITPATAIHVRRMSEARRLLSETKLSIGTIAGMCGYQDDLYFSQCFRKEEGVSPRKFRQMQQQGFTKFNGQSRGQ